MAARGVSTRSAIQTLAGVRLEAALGRRRAAGDRHGARHPRHRGGRRSSARAPSCSRAGCSSTSCARCRRTTCRSSTARRRVTSRSCPGPSRFHLRTLPADEFPKLPEIGDASVMRVPAGAFVETIGRVARSASRDETRPHLDRRAGVRVGEGAADGRDRLLPAEREGDVARRRAGGLARGERAGADAAGARAHLGERGRRSDRDRRARAPGHLPRRRRHAVVAARGGPLPELQASCCPTRSSTSCI